MVDGGARVLDPLGVCDHYSGSHIGSKSALVDCRTCMIVPLLPQQEWMLLMPGLAILWFRSAETCSHLLQCDLHEVFCLYCEWPDCPAGCRSLCAM